MICIQGLLYGKRVFARGFDVGDLAQVGGDIGFAFHAVIGHEANHAEDVALSPRTIMEAKTPQDTGVSIGVATVERVFVMEIDHGLEGVLAGGRPFDDFLSPIHTVVAVHFSAEEEFFLGGIPDVVVGFGGFELVASIARIALIGGVGEESFTSPIGKAGEALDLRPGIAGKIEGQFAADDHFFNVFRAGQVVFNTVGLDFESKIQ